MFWKKKKLSVFKNPHFWLLLTSVAIFFILLVLLSFINYGSFFYAFSIASILREGNLILMQMIATIYFIYYTIKYFDKKYGDEFLIKRYVYEIFFIAVFGFAINQFFNYLFVKWVVVPEEDMKALNQKIHSLVIVSQVLILIAYILLTGFRILKNLQQKQLVLLKLQKEFAQTQFEALKNQLNPHFLFNSLSVLTSLVYADADKAEKFIDKLSKTYRYLLDQREKEAVHILSEIEFLNNFEYLIEQRYGSKIIIKKQVPERMNNLFLLPHTMLIIFEFIIASNTMSATKPLIVDVALKNNYLLIRYSNQPKELPTAHLQDQFASLLYNYHQANKEITLFSDEFSQQQIIRIPLITA